MTASDHAARPYGAQRAPAPTGVSDIERLLAYEEIRQLASRYAVAMDSRDIDTLASLFVEDYRHWNGEVGRQALTSEFEQAFRGGIGGTVGFSNLGVHVINLLGPDQANGTVYCSAELGDKDRWIRQAIVYDDTYERRDGTWYFVGRDHQLVYGVDVDRHPLQQPPAEWPRSMVGLGTVPYAWPTWDRFYANGNGS